MILTKKVKIKTKTAKKKYYENLGYDMSNEYVEINVDDLSKGSHIKIKVKCDCAECGKEREIPYKQYLSSSKLGYYTCGPKCSQSKNKITNNIKYGFDYPLKSDIVKNKSKKTCLEKYGVNSPTKTNEHKEKLKKIYLVKYGVDNPSKSKEIKEKRKNTMIERYGVEYYVLSDDFLEKSQETSIKNFGTKHPNQSNIIKQRKIDYRKENGLYVETNEFKLYHNKIDCETRKYKKELFDCWNGLDFYDDKYIKDNLFLFEGTHALYPTIDHKISIKYGFMNNIEPEIIGNINNLCITTRSNNSSKSYKNIF